MEGEFILKKKKSWKKKVASSIPGLQYFTAIHNATSQQSRSLSFILHLDYINTFNIFFFLMKNRVKENEIIK